MALDVLTESNTVAPYHGCFRYAVSDYPARGVNLRGMTDYNVDIYCGTEIIGEIDPIGARGTLYKDAIYQHLGRRYMSTELDLDKKLCRVEQVNVDYYTEAVWNNRVEMTECEEEKSARDAALAFGYVHVNKQPKLYKKIRERTFENVGYGPITLPPFEYDTTGFSLLAPEAWKWAADAVDRRFLGAALYGLGYLMRHTGPSLCMADIKDIETDVSLNEQEGQRWKSCLFLYDTHEGGVGYAEKIFEHIHDAIELAGRIIRECPCQYGCPSCVPPLPPGVSTEDLEQFLVESNAAVTCTESLLTALSTGEIVMPDVTVLRKPRKKAVEAPGVNEEMVKLNRRLQKAAGILRDKRERQH